MTTLDQFNSALKELDPHCLKMFVAAIGFTDGSIHARATVDDARVILSRGDDVLWFEIRPYGQPFTPGGYTRRATNHEWELLQSAHDYDVESALNDTRGM